MSWILDVAVGLFTLLFVLCMALAWRQAVPGSLGAVLLAGSFIGLALTLALFARREVANRAGRS